MKSRRRFTAEFKAKVALESIQGDRTVAELAKRHELHPNLIAQWKRQAIEKLARVFDDKALEPTLAKPLTCLRNWRVLCREGQKGAAA